MDVSRSIKTTFWHDPFVEAMTPAEKLLYLYLIVNPRSNLIGIYETTISRISFETGLEKQTVLKALERFESLSKVYYWQDWIVLPNFIKNQKLNDNMKVGAVTIFKSLPEWLKIKVLGGDYRAIINDSKAFESLLNGTVKLKEKEKEKGKEKSINGLKTVGTDHPTLTKMDECIEQLKNDGIPFGVLWDLYDKKTGPKDKIKTKWDKIPFSTQDRIIAHVERYVIARPHKQYRKNLDTYLNQKEYDNDIIEYTGNPNGTKQILGENQRRALVALPD